MNKIERGLIDRHVHTIKNLELTISELKKENNILINKIKYFNDFLTAHDMNISSNNYDNTIGHDGNGYHLYLNDQLHCSRCYEHLSECKCPLQCHKCNGCNNYSCDCQCYDSE